MEVVEHTWSEQEVSVTTVLVIGAEPVEVVDNTLEVDSLDDFDSVDSGALDDADSLDAAEVVDSAVDDSTEVVDPAEELGVNDSEVSVDDSEEVGQ